MGTEPLAKTLRSTSICSNELWTKFGTLRKDEKGHPQVGCAPVGAVLQWRILRKLPQRHRFRVGPSLLCSDGNPMTLSGHT